MDPKSSATPEEKLATAVDRFFDRAMEDPLLGLYFEDTDLVQLKKKFTTYMGLLLAGKEDEYPGPDVYNAHKGRDIMDEAADLFIKNLVTTLGEAGLAPGDVERMEKKLWGMKELVVGKYAPANPYVYKPKRFE